MTLNNQIILGKHCCVLENWASISIDNRFLWIT